MKIFLQLVLALALIVLCAQISLINEDKRETSVKDLKVNTTVYGVTTNKYDGFEKVKVIDEPAVEVKSEPEMNKHLDKISDDYIGAIEIPVLGTSDAIYKGPSDFYLNNNYLKQSSEIGEIYLDERTGADILGNGALFNGHAVPDGRKFGSFKKVLKVDEQPEVLIYDHTLNKVVVYKMLFVSLIDGDNSGIIMRFNSNEQQVQYYRNLYSTAIKKWEEPNEGDSFILLNSCSYIIQDGRYVIVAKRES